MATQKPKTKEQRRARRETNPVGPPARTLGWAVRAGRCQVFIMWAQLQRDGQVARAWDNYGYMLFARKADAHLAIKGLETSWEILRVVRGADGQPKFGEVVAGGQGTKKPRVAAKEQS